MNPSSFLSLLIGAALPLAINGLSFFWLRRPTAVPAPSRHLMSFAVRLIAYAVAVVAVSQWEDLQLGWFALGFVVIFGFLIFAEGLYLNRLSLRGKSTQKQ